MRTSSQRMVVKGVPGCQSQDRLPHRGGDHRSNGGVKEGTEGSARSKFTIARTEKSIIAWMSNKRRRICQHIGTFANKANNMVQRYYCWVKNSWYRGTGIEFREDIAALGALSFWVQCPRKGRRIISKISIQKIQELEDLCSWWSIGLREQKSISHLWRIEQKPRLQDCSADL